MNIKTLDACKVVFYDESTGFFGTRRMGQFLPRKAAPLGFLTLDEFNYSSNYPHCPAVEWLMEEREKMRWELSEEEDLLASDLEGRILFAFDASASVEEVYRAASPLMRLYAQVADREDVTVVTFTTEVRETRPENLTCMHGPTAFNQLVEYAEAGQFDRVIVVTDGYAERVQPQDASKWLWAITPGGTGWMRWASTPMRVKKLSEGFAFGS